MPCWFIQDGRQEPLGAYICDFVCYSKRLIIEADGDQHADSEHDKTRETYLESLGFRVLRFWNGDILSETDSVLDAIWEAVSNPPPQPAAGTPP